jgi:hypothetical protein
MKRNKKNACGGFQNQATVLSALSMNALQVLQTTPIGQKVFSFAEAKKPRLVLLAGASKAERLSAKFMGRLQSRTSAIVRCSPENIQSDIHHKQTNHPF